jgi:predicted acetyltransferase
LARAIRHGCETVLMEDVELVPVIEDDKPVLANLLQFYCYDMSAIREYDMTDHATYVYRYLDHYFLEPDRDVLLLRHSGALAGFVMSRAGPTGEREVAEFFVVRRHRRANVGSRAALALFARHPGRWIVAYDDRNPEASAFWPDVVERVAVDAVQREHLGPPDHRYERTELRFVTG